MGVYIEGMEMPKLYKTYKVRFAEEGGKILVGFADENSTAYRPIGEAIPVPPHGDLIDADKLVELCDIMADKCDGIGASIWHQFKTTVEWSPIVIPAEEGET